MPPPDHTSRNTWQVDVVPLAHAGHWAIWVLYSVPVLIVLGASFKAFRDERRAREREGS